MSRIPVRSSNVTLNRDLTKIAKGTAVPNPVVKSVQRGGTQIEDTFDEATIVLDTEVNPVKSVIFLDFTVSSSVDLKQYPVATFIDGTTVKFNRQGTNGITGIVYQIVEYY